MTYSAKDSETLREDGKFYGEKIARLINQIYPQKNAYKGIDDTLDVLVKIALDRLRENPKALPYIKDFDSGARAGYKIHRLGE
jgi:hypothetical protein